MIVITIVMESPSVCQSSRVGPVSESTKPETDKRSAPHQARSQRTMDLILSTAADLLEEVGFERLSTNLICKRAGLTPPALYRYFPNKYAILKELGERLMDRQNAVLKDWQLTGPDRDALRPLLSGILRETVRVTRDTRAGAWIMRSLHATPILADVRLQSHRFVATQFCEALCHHWPRLDPDRAWQTTRLGVELGYAAIEMIFDDRKTDEDAVIAMTTEMLAHNIDQLLDPSR